MTGVGRHGIMHELRADYLVGSGPEYSENVKKYYIIWKAAKKIDASDI